MALFDSLASEVNERFDLGDKGAALVSALLGLIAHNTGGLDNFLALFRRAGLGETADSWVSMGANSALSNQQTEDVLGADALGELANRAGVSLLTATSALSYLIPTVVDKLTPNGVMPDNNSLLETAKGYPIGTGATETGQTVRPAMPDRADAANSRLTTTTRNDDNSVLRWILPLALLIFLSFIGYQFCSKPNQKVALTPSANSNNSAAPVTNSNAIPPSISEGH